MLGTHDLERHHHSGSLVPQDVAMKHPDTLVISIEPQNNMAPGRDVNCVLSQWVFQVVRSTRWFGIDKW